MGEGLLAEAPYAILATGACMAGLWISNILFDLKVPHYISRKIGHAAGGLGFLMCAFLFSSAWWPLILTSAFGIMLAAARLARPATFRGVGGNGRGKRVLAEVWFAWTAVPVLAAGWLWLGMPLLAISAMLFMAWGDCVTGLVRSQVYGRPVKGLWGSVAMLLVCMAISWAFVKPFWVGAAGALAATVTEWAFGDVGVVRWADDNWAVPLVSITVMIGLLMVGGTI